MNEILEKLKASPYWREDFRLVEREHAGKGQPVYRIEASDNDTETVLLIIKLDHILKKNIDS